MLRHPRSPPSHLHDDDDPTSSSSEYGSESPDPPAARWTSAGDPLGLGPSWADQDTRPARPGSGTSASSQLSQSHCHRVPQQILPHSPSQSPNDHLDDMTEAGITSPRHSQQGSDTGASSGNSHVRLAGSHHLLPRSAHSSRHSPLVVSSRPAQSRRPPVLPRRRHLHRPPFYHDGATATDPSFTTMQKALRQSISERQRVKINSHVNRMGLRARRRYRSLSKRMS